MGTERIDIFDHIEIEGPLPKAVDEVMLFLKKHAMRGADLSEVRRKDVWSIPLGILREAVINAIVHTDYSQRGAPIRIVFLDDRIEIENPGILLPGLTIEGIKQGASRIRNSVIARAFLEMNFIEQWGTGVRRIFKDALELGLPEPCIEEVAMRMRFTIPLAEAHRIQGTEVGTQPEDEAPVEALVELSPTEGRIVGSLENTVLSSKELLSLLGYGQKTGNYKAAITRLLSEEIIEYTIPNKPNSRLQKYRITAKGLKMLDH